MAESHSFPKVEVRHIDEEKGKGLFAKTKFKDGDVIFEERPVVCAQFLWNQIYGYQACDFCLTPLETAEENVRRLARDPAIVLPYPACSATKKDLIVDCPQCEVSYCSIACRSQAWDQYHQVLCFNSANRESTHPLEHLQQAWRNMHFPPETASIMVIARIIATVKQAKDKAGAAELFSQFCHKTRGRNGEVAYKLLSKKYESQMEHLRELMIKGLYDEDIKHWFTVEGFQSLVALVGTNGQGIGTSAFNQWVKNLDNIDLLPKDQQVLNNFIFHMYDLMEEVNGAYINNEGSGLYALQSACNHSCVPNAEATFPYNNFTLVMEAVRDIEPGEEIFVCYLDQANRRKDKRSRNKLLRENYLFTCSCPKCRSEVSGVSSDSDDGDGDDEDESDEEDEGIEEEEEKEEN